MIVLLEQECCKRPPRVQIHMDARNQRSTFQENLLQGANHNIVGVMLMAGKRSYFSNKSVVRDRHLYKHIWTPGIDEALSVEKEPCNLHDNFAISMVKNKPYAGAYSQRSTHPQ